FRDNGLASLDRHVQIPSAKVEFAELLPHVVYELGTGFSRRRQQSQNEEVDEDPIPLRQMSREPDAAAFLATDENVILQHEFTNILETNRTLIDLQSELRCDPWNRLALRIGAYNRAAPPFISINV